MGKLSAGVVYSLLLALVWGIAYPLTRMAEAYASPIVIALIRVSLASLVIYPMVRKLIINLRMFIASILNMGLFLVLLNISILHTPNPGLAALMVYTQPLFVVLLERFMLKHDLSIRRALGVLLGFTGVALASVHAVSIDIGVVAGLAAGFIWALGTVLYSMWFRGTDPLVANASSSILSIPVVALALPIDPASSLTVWGVALVLLVAIDAQVLGFMLWFKAVSSERPSTVSSILLITPILALYFSALMLKSQLTTPELVGTVVTIIGLIMVMKST